MEKHLRYVEGFKGSQEELAISTCKMTYNLVGAQFGKSANEIIRQADRDYFLRDRKKLAAGLYAVADKLYQAEYKMHLVWKICKPHMMD